jgi:hypothetical protein
MSQKGLRGEETKGMVTTTSDCVRIREDSKNNLLVAKMVERVSDENFI